MQIRFTAAVTVLLSFFLIVQCGGRVEPVKTGQIPDGTVDPAEWGKVYPYHYESWLKTGEAKPSGQSKYRKGWDEDEIMYDRLSELPFLAVLYNGWGFGVEYNEPRGHHYSVTDQIEIDPSRVAPGGVCLACKSPYHRPLVEKHGLEYLKKPFMEAVDTMLPSNHRELAVACIDCHKSQDMSLSLNKPHLERGLAKISHNEPSRHDYRSLVCAQCHITYYVPRDEKGKTNADVELPWTGASWGNISIEHIIADLLSGRNREEWTQKVTGFRMPFIRHPEFELYSRGSVHWNAGVGCADCHMPYGRQGSVKMTDHDITSPMKTAPAMKACTQCHSESPEWLKSQVISHQDRITSMLIRAGYLNATVAKLFEMVHKERDAGRIIDQAVYAKAKDHYMQAFLRLVFIGAENSSGFHNPVESARILGDSIAYASKAENMLRQGLTKAGVNVPAEIPLEISKYINNRGKHKLNFRPEQEFPDPFGLQRDFTSPATKGL